MIVSTLNYSILEKIAKGNPSAETLVESLRLMGVSKVYNVPNFSFGRWIPQDFFL